MKGDSGGGAQNDQRQAGSGGAYWFFRGAKGVLSIPAVILIAAFVGFAVFARQANIPLEVTLIITVMVWALPNMVVLVSTMAAGAGITTAFFEVTLTAVRLMPLIASLMPLLRGDKTPRWKLMLVSHLVAVTSWAFANNHLPQIPREGRLSYFAGFVISLISLNLMAVCAAYLLIAHMPSGIAAALFILTPIYFLFSLAGAARYVSDHLATIFGLALGPVFYMFFPKLDLLLAGLLGGTAAYFLPRLWRYASRQS